MSTPIERAKALVAHKAVDTYVRDGTCIGLGTGSTAAYAVERTGARIREGLRIRAVATSHETERLCRENGVPLAAFGDETIDVAIDGADEVSPDWALIKGGGGALFREKAIALSARTFVVIVTRNKCVDRLGTFPLPIEVVPFSTAYVAREIEALGARVSLRRGREGRAFVTDNGNAILDCRFDAIATPGLLNRIVREIHGVVDTGLFVGLTSAVLVAEEDGTVAELRPLARTANGRA